MRYSALAVSIHPYFKIHPGKLDAVKALLPIFVEKTALESLHLFYEFTLNGEEVFCREAYEGAAGVLAHLENVGPELQQMLTMADLVRLELHGRADELEKLKKPLAALNPSWFEYQCGVN